MFFQLQSIDLKSLDSSTTIPSLRRQDLEAVQFKKPDLTTQEAISQEIKAKLSSIDAALDQLGAISAGLSVLRRSLLNSAFTGKLLKEMR
jgi:type I restriction enzyme S subunit